jgi:Holliday junction resolvase
VAKGITAERRVAREGQEHGYLVASLRHFGCPGDQLWLCPDGKWRPEKPLLIEVKSTPEPWMQFRREDRAALIAAALQFGCEPLLALIAPGLGGVAYLSPEDWP